MKLSCVHVVTAAFLLVLLGAFPQGVCADVEQQTVFDADSNGPTVGLTADQVDTLETEKFTFQTEISRLMNLIINSLYKNHEIFLRELISNASDALDKIRFLSLTDAGALSSNDKLSISIAADPVSKTLVITDTGVGMTRDQLRDNLGTIAKSGTSEFLKKLEENKADVTQIGQFGVGFYSAFLVADKVTVASKSNDDPEQHVWMSEAVDDFVIAKDPRGNTLGRGTQITLHLKEKSLGYLKQDSLKDLVSRYSEYINFPIYVWTATNVTEPVEKATEGQDDGEEDILEESLDKDEDDKEEEAATTTKTVHRWEQVNMQKPIWMRSSKEVTDEEYTDFYRAFVKDSKADPLGWTHYKGEGDVEFRSILYIPAKAGADFYATLSPQLNNIKLFVKRVFITDEPDLFPRWLSFLKGIVDADDLPLNVSRETLQKHRSLRTISKHLIKKALEMFATLSKKDKDQYATFTKEYGNALKFGAIESSTYRKKLAGLLRFRSSYEASAPTVSLDSYIERMKANQTAIYFLTGMDLEEIKQSPFVERLLARGYEVLYMTDAIDEVLIERMPGYNGKMFVNVAKGDIKLGDEDEEESASDLEAVFGWLKETLAEHINTVKVSTRLTTSPMAIVAPAYGLTGHKERLMAAQHQGDANNKMMFEMMKAQKKILEINPSHPIIKTLAQRVAAEDVDTDLKELITALYETTAVRSGYPLSNLVAYTKRIEAIIRKGMGTSLTEQVEVNEPAAPEKTEEEKEKDEELRRQASVFEEAEDEARLEEEEDDDEDSKADRMHDEL